MPNFNWLFYAFFAGTEWAHFSNMTTNLLLFQGQVRGEAIGTAKITFVEMLARSSVVTQSFLAPFGEKLGNSAIALIDSRAVFILYIN
jgi:hypothetical protein